MSSDEQGILELLKASPKEFFSTREISLRAGRWHRSREHVDWALPVLKQFLNRGLVEANSMDHYRLKPGCLAGQDRARVSPQIAAILKAGGREVSEILVIKDDGTTLTEYVTKLASLKDGHPSKPIARQK